MAGLISVTADFDAAIRAIGTIRDEQLPFAIARTLTMLAQDGQAAGREEEKGVFTNRNDWTVRNTKITAATKQTLKAEVFTDTANRRTGAPDYLVRQEEGGERVPVNGREHIAIPTDYLRRMVGFNNIIPDDLRPKAMLAYAENRGRLVGRGPKGRLRLASIAVRGMYFFKVDLKSGAMAILARHANDPRENAYPMYILVTRAHIRQRFHLDEDVDKAVQANLEHRFQLAAAETITNDALRGSGLSVKF
jgi:hypothetical protein